MAPIDAAQERGVDITLECYPYPAGAGFALYMMPRWANVGGYGALMARLSDPHLRRRIMSDMRLGLLEEITYGPRSVSSSAAPSGRSEDLGLDEAEFICQLLLENNLAVGHISRLQRSLWEQLDRDLMELLLRPNYMVGSDAVSRLFIPPRTYTPYPVPAAAADMAHALEALDQPHDLCAGRRFGLKWGELWRVRPRMWLSLIPSPWVKGPFERPKQLSEGFYTYWSTEQGFSHGKALGVLAGRGHS